jgi:hypothetical protein
MGKVENYRGNWVVQGRSSTIRPQAVVQHNAGKAGEVCPELRWGEASGKNLFGISWAMDRESIFRSSEAGKSSRSGVPGAWTSGRTRQAACGL